MPDIARAEEVVVLVGPFVVAENLGIWDFFGVTPVPISSFLSGVR